MNCEYTYTCDIIDPITGRAVIQDYTCNLIIEDWDRASNSIDIHDVYSTDGLRLLDGGVMAQCLRKIIVFQAKKDEWLKDQVFSRNEDDDPKGTWARADAQRDAQD